MALFGLAVDYWIHLYVAAAAAPQGKGFAGRLAAAEGAAYRLAPALALAAEDRQQHRQDHAQDTRPDEQSERGAEDREGGHGDHATGIGPRWSRSR